MLFAIYFLFTCLSDKRIRARTFAQLNVDSKSKQSKIGVSRSFDSSRYDTNQKFKYREWPNYPREPIFILIRSQTQMFPIILMGLNEWMELEWFNLLENVGEDSQAILLIFYLFTLSFSVGWGREKCENLWCWSCVWLTNFRQPSSWIRTKWVGKFLSFVWTLRKSFQQQFFTRTGNLRREKNFKIIFVEFQFTNCVCLHGTLGNRKM